MPDRDNTDPYSGFNFAVEFDGALVGAFAEVSGLEQDAEAVEHRENVDESPAGGKFVGVQKLPSLTLRRGVVRGESLWAWYKNSRNNTADKRRITVVQRDEAGREIARWEVSNAWINKIQGPNLKGTGNEIAIESMALDCEGLIVTP